MKINGFNLSERKTTPHIVLAKRSRHVQHGMNIKKVYQANNPKCQSKIPRNYSKYDPDVSSIPESIKI